MGRPRFDPWVGKIPWRRVRLPTPVFWPGGFHGLFSAWGHRELDMTEGLSLHSIHPFMGAPLAAQLVKNPPAIQETSVGFLGWEDSLEKA